MARTPLRIAAVLAASSLALVACVDDEGIVDQEGTLTPTTGVATPTEEPEAFETNDVSPEETDEISGEIVEDPGMSVHYKWQGTKSAPNGGTVVTIAVTNTADAIMPPEALGEPRLTYSGDNASRLSAEEAGIEIEGLYMPLGKGATANLQFAFDVSTGNLYDAEFQIGNVVFTGNLNN